MLGTFVLLANLNLLPPEPTPPTPVLPLCKGIKCKTKCVTPKFISNAFIPSITVCIHNFAPSQPPPTKSFSPTTDCHGMRCLTNTGIRCVTYEFINGNWVSAVTVCSQKLYLQE